MTRAVAKLCGIGRASVMVLLVSCLVLGIVSSVGAQGKTRLEASGHSVRISDGSGSVTLSGEPLVIPEGLEYIVTGVEGDNAGFWIQENKPSDGVQPLAHFNSNKSALGYKLLSGTYYIYPVVSQYGFKANVRVRFLRHDGPRG